jgi:hypothetical protein
MYTSGLVPRRMTWLGLIGGPLLLVGNLGVLFNFWEQTGAVGLLVAPEFLWELLLGIYAAILGRFSARHSGARDLVDRYEHRQIPRPGDHCPRARR